MFGIIIQNMIVPIVMSSVSLNELGDRGVERVHVTGILKINNNVTI